MTISRDVLVADIGGTNARFAVPRRQGSTIELCDVANYATADFPTLEAAIRQYLQDIGATVVPRRILISVASPVTDDIVKIVNNPWRFSLSDLRDSLGVDTLKAINDFAAVSHAVPSLTPHDLVAIGDALPATDTPMERIAVVGPGTGLGVGAAVLVEGRTVVIPSEGGHVGFSPGTPIECRILETLMTRFGRVSVERLLSGPGLVNLYEAVCAIEGVKADDLSPADITARAAAESCSPCGRVLEIFCEILGSVAGDVALNFGAWNGIYLAGGITPRILPWLHKGGFRRRFEDKGRFQDRMRKIPILAIVHPNPGLLGAAAYLQEAAPD